MSVHTKMASDYIWVRHAPVEQGVKFRNHGYHYLYNRAPNRVERLEMIYRSMGKQFDWELQKFRLGRKSIDRGNKRRLFRNFVRLVKNPIGYLSWKSVKYTSASMPRLMVVIFGFTWLAYLIDWKQTSNELKKHDDLLLAYGKNIEGMSGRYTGYHNTNFLRGPVFFDAMFRTGLTPDQIVISQSWKANLRKQLQLTNSDGVVF